VNEQFFVICGLIVGQFGFFSTAPNILVLGKQHKIGFVLHKKVVVKIDGILVFGLKTGMGVRKIGFVWV
jgi:hypothetical protein